MLNQQSLPKEPLRTPPVPCGGEVQAPSPGGAFSLKGEYHETDQLRELGGQLGADSREGSQLTQSPYLG